MVKSMTGYAGRRGQSGTADWIWDLRAVNGKGLDLRLRLPDGINGIESAARSALAAVAQRGNVTLSLKVNQSAGADALRINPVGLAAAMTALLSVSEAIHARGLPVAPIQPEGVLTLRGVLDFASDPMADESPEQAALRNVLLADLMVLIADFDAHRIAEGLAIGAVILTQIERIAALHAEAAIAAEARRAPAALVLHEALARVAAVPDADPARVAQELALMAVKSDVTEELDRLAAHIAAARLLMSQDGAVGRKLDFLMQEFMREANTLCSKSGSVELTRIGLDLKVTIDQMREQIQNVE